MRITRPVGDIFVYNVPGAPMDVWLNVLKTYGTGGCNGCVFASRPPYNCNRVNGDLTGYCTSQCRSDGNNVIFKQIGTYKPQKGVEYGD